METCKHIDTCFKIDMIRDKDMLDYQFVESVKTVCDKCDEFEEDQPVIIDTWHYTGRNFGDRGIWESDTGKQQLREKGTGRVMFDPEVEGKKWKN